MDTKQLFSTENIDLAPGERQTDTVDTQKYLLFLSDTLLFGVMADYVVEIITHHVITSLPLVPSYVSGIINLRGQIIPIVDIRHILGQETAESDCMIILNIDGTLVGILVDTVQKMLDVNTASILPSPSKECQNLVSGMCSLPDGSAMLVFDCQQLLHSS